MGHEWFTLNHSGHNRFYLLHIHHNNNHDLFHDSFQTFGKMESQIHKIKTKPRYKT